MPPDERQQICVIPARGGSTRIPGKNMKLFHGKPILQYSIEKARESGVFGKVIVSSDCRETLDFAKSQGALIWPRIGALSKDEVGTQDVTLDVVTYQKHITVFEYVCCLYATAPLMDVQALRSGLELLKIYPELHFAYAAGDVDGQRVHAGQFYWSRTSSLIKGLQLDEVPTGYIHVPPNRLCDINTQQDWERAEQMYESLQP